MFPRRVLFIENSIGLSGSTMSLTTLLNSLDRSRFEPCIAVSRPEQAAYLREHLHEPAPVALIGPGMGIKQRVWLKRLTEAGSPLPRGLRHGLLRVAGLLDLAVVADPLETKSVCPITKLAAIPPVKGGMYSSTRLLKVSVVQRLPLPSKATPAQTARPFWVVLTPKVVKSGWPMTRLAAMPLVNGGLNCRTRWLSSSQTQRLPA